MNRLHLLKQQLPADVFIRFSLSPMVRILAEQKCQQKSCHSNYHWPFLLVNLPGNCRTWYCAALFIKGNHANKRSDYFFHLVHCLLFLNRLALARFQLQELPSMSIQPYLIQNIRRRDMLRFLNTRSLIHVINFLPLFVFIPFTVVEIVPAYGGVAGSAFLIAMFSLVFNNHFLNMYIKRKTVNNSWFFFGMLVIITALKGLDYLKIWSFEKVSSQIFIALLYTPIF